MNDPEKLKKFSEKILAGLELAYAKLLIQKREKNSFLVIMRDGKIIKIKP